MYVLFKCIKSSRFHITGIMCQNRVLCYNVTLKKKNGVKIQMGSNPGGNPWHGNSILRLTTRNMADPSFTDFWLESVRLQRLWFSDRFQASNRMACNSSSSGCLQKLYQLFIWKIMCLYKQGTILISNSKPMVTFVYRMFMCIGNHLMQGLKRWEACESFHPEGLS